MAEEALGPFSGLAEILSEIALPLIIIGIAIALIRWIESIIKRTNEK